jgi:glucokinase
MSLLDYPALLGDVGGTNARFAWQAAPGCEMSQVLSLSGDDHENLESAIQAYLKQTGLPHPQSASIGIANPITGDFVQMTNRDWSFSIQALKHALKLRNLLVINDFTAVALALPSLPAGDRLQIGGGEPAPNSAIALLGAGTGLGVSGLLPCGSSWTPICGEGGHVTLSASNQTEFGVIEILARRFGHVSAERVLSGPGLTSLHSALAELKGISVAQELTAAEISDQALNHKEPLALQAVEMFAGFLGSVAGDLALTLGARGGVYIAGGIIPRWLGWFEHSSFRERFEAKGRFSAYLRPIPVWVITTPVSPALAGAAFALSECS